MHSFQSAPQHRQAIVSTPLLNRTRPQNPAQFATPQQTTRQVPRQDLLRKPIGRPSPNGAPQHVGYQGYGMSGGMKTSYPQVTQSALGYNENRNRPRGMIVYLDRIMLSSMFTYLISFSRFAY